MMIDVDILLTLPGVSRVMFDTASFGAFKCWLQVGSRVYEQNGNTTAVALRGALEKAGIAGPEALMEGWRSGGVDAGRAGE